MREKRTTSREVSVLSFSEHIALLSDCDEKGCTSRTKQYSAGLFATVLSYAMYVNFQIFDDFTGSPFDLDSLTVK